MNRIDRVSAILIHLQSKRIVKAQEIADRFEISLRTVYRDIRTLEDAGIPIIGEAGLGYSIMDGYKLPPVMFTREEAVAFITAEKLIEKMADSVTDEHFKSAMYKIKAVFRNSEKDFMEDLSSRIEVMKHPNPNAVSPEARLMDTVMKNLTEKRVLNMQYVALSTEVATEREIEPIGVFYANKHWHLIAYCRLRQDYRDFRLDRITHVEPTRHTFKARHPSLQEYLKSMAEKNDLERVVISFSYTAMKYICEQKYYYGYVNEENKGDRVEMTFLTPSLSYMAHWLLTFSNKAEVISPFKLKEEIKSLVETLYDHYNNYDFAETLLT